MTKGKRNKPRFWCHTCQFTGYRFRDEAEAKAALLNKEVWPCPNGHGFHFGSK